MHQKGAVDLLKAALEKALAGEVTSIAIVLCGTGGFQPAIAGPQAPELYLGLEACKQRILNAVMTPPTSPIIRPRR